jgi:small subunit ribosomal protein S21
LKCLTSDDIIDEEMWKGGLYMTKVVVQNGNIDLALKKFKAKVARSGVPSEIKKRKHYEKPGVRRRNEIKEGIKNSHKKNRG